MISRVALVAVLALVEVAIASETVVAVRGDQPARWSMHANGYRVDGPNLAEGGPHRLFDAGSHPALTVDIGNADLTIRAGTAAQFDAAVSKSTAFGIFRARAPITAEVDGDTLRIATSAEHSWSMGDDRMVTLIVPAQTRVTVASAGHTRATGLLAEASFNSANGNVTVEDYRAPALHVESSNGRIALIRVAAARLDVSASDGRIEGSALQVRDGSVESSNDRVTLEFAAGSDSIVTAQTSNGNIHLSGIPGAASARDNGSDNDESSRTVRIGPGNGRFDVQSSNGNIYLSQL